MALTRINASELQRINELEQAIARREEEDKALQSQMDDLRLRLDAMSKDFRRLPDSPDAFANLSSQR